MKTQNIKLAILSIILLVTVSLTAQETITVPLTNPSKPGLLKMSIINGSITVKGYSGNEVIVKATRIADSKSHTKKIKEGLKKISNSSLEFSATEYDNEVRVRSSMYSNTADFEIQVPKNFSLKISTVNNGDIYVENVNGAIDVSNVNGKITLKDISGSVSTNTVRGDIVVNFIKVTPNVAMAFSSLNGDIDVTFPKTIKANIKIKSDRGEIYTDFNLNSTASKPKVTKSESEKGKSYRVKLEKWIEGSINGGGPEMLFKNFNGDVIIRSK